MEQVAFYVGIAIAGWIGPELLFMFAARPGMERLPAGINIATTLASVLIAVGVHAH